MTPRPIPGHLDYAAGADGAIWSCKTGEYRQMKIFDRGNGYLAVNLTQNGKYRMYSVHRLVALAWIGDAPSPAHLVMHKDDVRHHNDFRNLCYGLPKNNSADMTTKGRQARGERVGGARLTADLVREIRSINRLSQRTIARRFGISPTTVCEIRRRETWRHI